MSEGYATPDDEVEIERRRLALLAETRDPKTIGVLERTGIGPGWHCLELGAGTGSISKWMADQVGSEGRVMSTDIDLRFHIDPTDNMIVREHDISADRLPAEHFDLVHARAVLQHIPQRIEVVDTLKDLLKPGGWLVLEDGNFMEFAEQPLPEPYQTVHKLVAGATHETWREPNFGLQLPHVMRQAGFEDIDAVGDVWAMRPGEASGEWWFLALERAIPKLVEFEVIDAEQGADALAQVRAPGFVMLSSTSISCTGRKPGS